MDRNLFVQEPLKKNEVHYFKDNEGREIVMDQRGVFEDKQGNKVYQDKQDPNVFRNQKGSVIFEDKDNEIQRIIDEENKEKLEDSIEDFRDTEPEREFTENEIEKLDDLIEDIPDQSKQKFYTIVENKLMEPDREVNLQESKQVPHIHLNLLIQLLSHLVQYQQREQLLTYLLLMTNEKKRRCPNGSRRKVVNCMKVKPIPRPRCPNGYRRKNVYCKQYEREINYPRCPNGSHRRNVYCVKQDV